MNYNTNRTIQAVCAKALIYQTDRLRRLLPQPHYGSCFSLGWLRNIVSLMKDYRLHSGAYTEATMASTRLAS
jgi:hypothetical protein